VKNIKIKEKSNHGLRGFIFIVCAITAMALVACGGGGDPDPDGPGDGDNITVTFNLGGAPGTPPSDITIKNNTSMGNKYPSSEPKRTGYDFEGWYNSGTQYTKDTVINVSTGKTFLLTARWKDEDAVEYAQNPAIHPGNHFIQTDSGTEINNAKVNVPFKSNGLFSNIERGAGVLTSKWYRTTSQTDADAATTALPTGTMIFEQSAAGTTTPHELALPFTWTETTAGTYWYYVIVTNTNENATKVKTSSSITQNRLKVTVTN